MHIIQYCFNFYIIHKCNKYLPTQAISKKKKNKPENSDLFLKLLSMIRIII